METFLIIAGLVAAYAIGGLMNNRGPKPPRKPVEVRQGADVQRCGIVKIKTKDGKIITYKDHRVPLGDT